MLTDTIPQGTSFVLTETNDSPDSYKVTMQAAVGSAAASDIYAQTIVASGDSATASSVTLSDKVDVDIENLLDAISPTGYVSRFAPFVLMLAGGVLLLAMTRRIRRRVA